MGNRWKSTYEQRITTAEKAVARVVAGDHVFVASAAGEPAHLVRALTARAGELADVELFQIHPMGDMPYLAPGLSDHVRADSFFVSEGLRDAVAECRADYTPAFMSQIPGLLRSGRLPMQVALVSVTPPDEHGYVSLGLSVDVTRAAVDAADLVIAQVNRKMPRTLGGALLPVAEIDLFVEFDEDPPVLAKVEADEVHERIAAHIGRLVPDGATIQVGIGRIPNAVMAYLRDKSDLGVHTELLTDGLMELAKAGIINGRRKALHPGKMVASLAMGSADLYRWMDANPSLELHPSEYVNSVANIAANHRMVAINTGLEVDLTGQVCADSFGFRFYSGMGGHADFIRGAALAPEGKPIIALPSTAETPQGRVSRITPALKEGAGVLTTRGDIHYVVTEHGIAYLHGKNMRERAMALIAVADPDHRQDLLHAAKSRRLVFAHQIIPARGTVYPEELETMVALETGTDILFRPIKATDDELVKDLFYSFSEKTRFQRFMRVVKAMPHSERQVFCNIDYQQEMAILATLEVESTEEALGVGRYMYDEGTKSAEIAVVVRDDWQGRGIGRHLFERLAEIAKGRGIAKFTASVLVGNEAMMNIFRSVAPHMKSHAEKDVIRVEIDLTKMPLRAAEKKEPPKA